MRFLKYSVVLLLSTNSFTSKGSNPFVVSEINQVVSIGKGIEYYEDKSAQETPVSVLKKQFYFFKSGNVNFGLSNSAYWLKFNLLNKSLEDRLLLKIGYPLLDSIDVYFVQDGYPVLHKFGGDRYVMAQAEIRNPLYYFYLPLPKGVQTQILLRVRTTSSFQIPIEIGTEGKIIQISEENSVWYGLYYGILLVMILYNIFIYFSLKDKVYIYYSASIFCSLYFFTIFYGHARYWFWPDFLTWNQRAVHIAMGLLSMTSAAFAIVFLELKTFVRWLYYPMLAVAILGLFLVLFCYSLDIHTSTHFATFLIMANAIIMLVSGVVSWANGNKSARLFVVAWSAYLLGALLLIFRNLGMLPSNMFTSHFANLGSAAEVILLSLALADKYSLLRAEKERAQDALLELQKDANFKLEQKVRDRTRQLEEEKEKTENLLLNILPAPVAEELKNSGQYMARRHEHVTVMFSDFVNFTHISEKMIPELLVFELDIYFKKFDEIIAGYQIEKIKTIGDAYLCVSGLHEDVNHALDICRAAVDIRNYMNEVNNNKGPGEFKFELRLGIHSGSLVAGVVGSHKFAYDIWGDTVNIAARMEQNSVAGKINVSHETYMMVKDHFKFEARGSLPVKNKGEIEMHFLELL